MSEVSPLLISNSDNAEQREPNPTVATILNESPLFSSVVAPVVTTVVGLLCLPMTLACGFFTVKEREEAVVLSFGKYAGTIREPGLHFSNCWGREIIPISKSKTSIEIHKTKVIDKDGNPVLVSGVVFYHFEDTRKAALDIFDRQTFVSDQAAAVMKQIVSQYPYEHRDTDNTNDNDYDDDESSSSEAPCLKQSSPAICSALVTQLQKQVNISGAVIDGFKFNEISYAPEIAASLLKKQQASAIVSSRHTLVDGAVRIASEATRRLANKNSIGGGAKLSAEDQGRLISNILTVICADEHVRPVILLGST